MKRLTLVLPGIEGLAKLREGSAAQLLTVAAGEPVVAWPRATGGDR